ncbi:MAG TPA: glycosyltransferase family 9 protein [Bryobacteraceae bacterium]|nr:glycosyltransferase family 9 protein [Bryobacteraceae bacterium]
MFTAGKPENVRILVVRLGALGDILHALPAVASLKTGYPGSRLTWVVEARWAPLVEANPFVDRVVLLRRQSAASLLESWRELRSERYQIAVDFQGLLKSALVAAAARPGRIFGFDTSLLRERAAGVFYSRKTLTEAAHVVDRNLDLAAAAGATTALRVFPLPPGRPEGELPPGAFVLASPLAGWRSKQWPAEHYRALGARLRAELGMPLVVNLPPSSAGWVRQAGMSGAAVAHVSGLEGLIDATRRAAAVVGVDSGPLHLAAALEKPGVAIFGPTDPARNGPYGGTLRVLRAEGAVTTYKRHSTLEGSMTRVTPDEVFEALRSSLSEPGRPEGCSSR